MRIKCLKNRNKVTKNIIVKGRNTVSCTNKLFESVSPIILKKSSNKNTKKKSLIIDFIFMELIDKRDFPMQP